MSDPKRVLYICPNSIRGGAEQVTWLLARYHDRARWLPQVYFFSQGPLVDELRSQGVRCHVRPRRPLKLRLRNPLSVAIEAKAIISLIRQERIDLVHSTMGYGHILGGLAALAARVPEVWFQHGPTGSLDWLTGQVPTRRIYVNSRHTLGKQKRFRAWTQGLEVIPLGIEPIRPDDWRQAAAPFRDRAGKDAIVFGLPGRISPLKGHLLFAEAAKVLLDRLPSGINARFMVIGDVFLPPDREYLKQVQRSIDDLGLTEHFIFTGQLSPPYPAMLACDVIVNASIAPEGFGLTLVEAMMLEKPVVAPAEGGPLETVIPEKTGILFEPRSRDQLAEAMLRLASSRTERVEMGARGAQHARENFQVTRMVERLEASYERIFSSR